MYDFGTGFLYGVPTADAAGVAIANPTPQQFSVLQDVSVDVSFENKMLHGQNQFPVAVGRGKGKIGIKAKFGNINGGVFNSLFFGAANATSGLGAVNDQTGILIPTTPFTITASTAAPSAITVQIPSSGVWVRDLSVRNASGNPMTRVPSAPTTGQYTVAAGVYVFASADVGLRVYISFEYSFTSTTAPLITVNNSAMGYAPTFIMVLNAPFQGKQMHWRFPAVIAGKLALPLKNDDFTIPEMEFDAFADATGNIATIGLTE